MSPLVEALVILACLTVFATSVVIILHALVAWCTAAVIAPIDARRRARIDAEYDRRGEPETIEEARRARGEA